MDTLEKNQRLNGLYIFYQNLLTDKQRLYFNAYYLDDYSLQEVADIYQVSRNAIFDQLKKTEEHLLNYERILKLYEQKNNRVELLQLFLETKDLEYIKKLKEMDEI